MAEKPKICAAAFELEPKVRSYEDFHPYAELNTEEKDNNILTVYLPGIFFPLNLFLIIKFMHAYVKFLKYKLFKHFS